MEITGTTLQTILLTPHYDKRLHISSWRADICYQAHPSEFGETVSISVLVPAGDRSVVALQREAIERARQIFDFAVNLKVARIQGVPKGTLIDGAVTGTLIRSPAT